MYKMNLYRLILLVLTALFLSSCEISMEKQDAVLTYKGEALTQEDVNLYLANMSGEIDSVRDLENLKRDWLTKQIIIRQAKEKLPAKETNLSYEMLQYKSDLLYFKYLNSYIRSKLNTQVSIEEVDSFYTANSTLLKTKEPFVKSVYISIPKALKKEYRIKYWLKSKSKKFQEKLNIYCYQNAKSFEDFDNEWLPLSKLKQVAQISELRNVAMKERELIEYETDSLRHYLFISEVMPKGSALPREQADKVIKEMITNIRKKKLQNELETRIANKVDEILEQK